VEAAQTVDGRWHDEDAAGVLLAQIIIGMQLAWDIPTLLFVPSLWSPLISWPERKRQRSGVHHVGMTAVALVSLLSTFGQYHLPFFTGVVELSSIPLAVVDIFHPSKFGAYAERSVCLGALNLACRLCFVLSFVLIRNVMFPAIVAFQGVPDLVHLLLSGEDDWPAPTAGLVVAIGFTGLQLHWGLLLVKQLAKMLKGGGEKQSAPAGEVGAPRPLSRRRSSLKDVVEDVDLEELSGRTPSRRSTLSARSLAAHGEANEADEYRLMSTS